ncbi:hypothetical protein PMX22_10085 [Clostridium butyricum]|jgi:hypothetical protein|uniref:hypothetical protein n=1 Tax=Clostridium butyricum TaxID=1492 RepID=UPI0020627338|nr:hypothetical protein [Clostridium butyricum]MDB2160150.1 hypothetical protein [Clostridium butyricum]DAQ97516.1 MAG TPA: replicative helicase [Caudoviricetes sp.]
MTNTERDYEKLLQNTRRTAEGRFCGLFLKYPDLIMDYDINRNLFSDETKFFMGLVYNCVEKGVYILDEVTITEYVESVEFLNEKFKSFGGYGTIKELMFMAQKENADAIVDEFVKWKMVEDLYNKGYIRLEKMWATLVKAKSSQLQDIFEHGFSDMGIKSFGDIERETLSLTDKEVQELKDGMMMGIQFGKYSHILNYLTMGLPKGELTLFASYTNGGKSSFMTANVVIPIAEQGTKVTIIANEQKSLVYKLMLMTYVLNERLKYFKIPRKKLKSGQWSEEDERYIEEARKIIREEYEPYISFWKVYDYDMKKVSTIAKKEAKLGCEVLVYDTFKYSGENESAWMSLLNDSKELLQICSKNNLAGVVTCQLALATKNKKRIIDETILSNGKQISEVFAEMIGWRDVFSDEFADGESDIKPYTIDRDADGKYIKIKDENGSTVYKTTPVIIRPNKDKMYKIFFHFKTRSDAVGTQILYEFVGYRNQWKELGYCNVTGKDRF